LGTFGNTFHSGEVDRKTYIILKSIMPLSEYFLVACFEEVIGNLGKKEKKCLGNDANMSFALPYDVAFSLWSQISHNFEIFDKNLVENSMI
jgi:hypothetical protein